MKIIIYHLTHKAIADEFAKQFDRQIIASYDANEISVDDALRLARRAKASLLII